MAVFMPPVSTPTAVVIDPKIHEVISPPGMWVSAVNGQCPWAKAMLHRHRGYGTFVVSAIWSKDERTGRTVVHPLANFTDHPDRLPLHTEMPFVEPGDIALKKVPPVLVFIQEAMRPSWQMLEELERKMAEQKEQVKKIHEEDKQALIDAGNAMAHNLRRHKGDHPKIKRMQEGHFPRVTRE